HLHWLALDATPIEEAPAAPPFSLGKWWESCRNAFGEIWRIFVAEYGVEEQSALADALWGQLSPSSPEQGQRFPTGAIAAALGGVPALLAALAGFYLWRRRRRRQTATALVLAPAVRFYARLLELLGQHRQLRPRPAQTPREFSATAADVLRG